MTREFSFALKLLKENIKYFEENEELGKYTSARDIVDYYLVLTLMYSSRHETLKVIISKLFNFFLNSRICKKKILKRILYIVQKP